MPTRETPPSAPERMRVGLRVPDVTDERLRFCKQLGVDDVFLTHVMDDGGPGTVTIRGDYAPSVAELEAVKDRAEEAGIRLHGISTLNRRGVYDDILLGRDGSEEQLATIKTLVRNMGDAGLSILGYMWNVVDAPDTLDLLMDADDLNEEIMITDVARKTELRGGAITTETDLTAVDDYETPVEALGREYSETELWANYEHFLNEVIPVAEDAGVRLAVHPDDPPADRLGGTPRLLRNFETHKKALALHPSDHHGLQLGLGVFSEIGADVAEVVRYFGERDKLVFIHFRDVVGTMPTYYETFHDDPASNFDPYEMMQTLHDVGFNGVMLPDHYPIIEGDTTYQHRSRAFTVGYLRALVDTVTRET